MIDAMTLRKLGTAPSYAPPATFANACRDAADTIEELARSIDGSVRVAADALKEIDRLRAALEQLKERGQNMTDLPTWAYAIVHEALDPTTRDVPPCHPNDGPWVANGFGEPVCSVCGNPRST